MSIPHFVLNTGAKIPAISFGSAATLPGADIQALVSHALKAGFYHIDTAESYGTEDKVGEAIKGIPRGKLFVTTKVSQNVADPAKGLEESLKKLGLDYVDLYLIHSPNALLKADVQLSDAWKALEQLQKVGKTKAIGVSNFGPLELAKLLQVAEIKPAVNQIEYSPYLRQKIPGAVEFSQKHGIVLTAYAPLSPFLRQNKDGPLLPVFEELAKKYDRTAAQINLNWVYQKGLVPIIISSKRNHIDEAIRALDFSLEQADVDKITQVGDTFKFVKW